MPLITASCIFPLCWDPFFKQKGEMMSDPIFTDNTSTKKINNVNEFVSLAIGINFPPIYRGQSDIEDGLVPTIARKEHNAYGLFERNKPLTKTTEKNFIHRFKRHTYRYFNRTLNDWEALFLARHHGLPVRLLDWTTNPLAALYWACDSKRNAKKDGAIWVFRNTTETTHKYIDIFNEVNPFCVSEIKVIFPFYSSPRMIAQSSLFTLHPYPWSDLAELTAECNEAREIADGQKWRVPEGSKKRIMEELYKLRVNAQTLFPDLDGIANQILNTELIFRQNR